MCDFVMAVHRVLCAFLIGEAAGAATVLVAEIVLVDGLQTEQAVYPCAWAFATVVSILLLLRYLHPSS